MHTVSPAIHLPIFPVPPSTMLISTRSITHLLIVALLLLHVPAFSQSPAAKKEPKPLDAVGQMAAKLEPTRTVVYKRVSDRELVLNIFEPAGHKPADKRPCFLVIHGGGWSGMEPRRMYPFAADFAKKGLLGISLQYRLSNSRTGFSVFDCVKDARSSVRYVRAHAAELGIDPNKITVSGGSAGGHLAAATALFDAVNEDTDDLKVSPIPNALVLLFPVIDTSTEGYGHEKIGERWKEISPAHLVRAGVPPTLIFHGTADPTTAFKGAKLFQEEMLKAGNRCELDAHEGGAHGYLMRTQELYDNTMRKSEKFLASLNLMAK
jgi:acetyl esterase